MGTSVDLGPGPYHFVGVGGYGMSGLAFVLHRLGYPVTGCDLADSRRMSWLSGQGISISLGHSPAHLIGAASLVYSTDIPSDHPEILAARSAGIPLWHRSDILARLIDGYADSIAVTGTHGKTSTTALMDGILRAAKVSATTLVGGEIDGYGATARMDGKDLLLAEACESDGTFLQYRPKYWIVNNIEPEHLEFYDGDFAQQTEAFRRAIHHGKPGGAVVLNYDDSVLRTLRFDESRTIIWCSCQTPQGTDYYADVLDSASGALRFRVWRRQQSLGVFQIPATGVHMVTNALHAVALADRLQLDISDIRLGLSKYSGVKRRFEVVGTRDGVTVVDDYAHHPTEIEATLRAARTLTKGRLLAVFQPQRYTRTQHLMEEFGRAFQQADALILMPIYSPAGQKPIPGVSTARLADRISVRSEVSVSIMARPEEIIRNLRQGARSGDVILTLGAGDIWKIAERLVADW